MAKYLGSYLVDKLAMDGTTSVLDNISGAAFTKTGGALGAWTDASNFRTLLGAQAPVIAETSDNLDANANCIFTPWASVTWVASGGYGIAADVDGTLGSASMRVTHAVGGYVVLSRAVTVGQPYTNSCYVKAGNAGAIGRTLSLVFDAVTTNIVLTNNWQRVSVTKASASATPRATTAALAAGSAGDQFLMSAFQRENKAYATPFALDYRTGGYCRIANPLTAGGDASFVFLVNSPWAGNDGIEHTLFSASGAGAGDVFRLYKGTDNKLYFAVGDKAAVTAALTTTTWAANVNHLVIGTVTGGTINVYLAGTAGTPATGATREAALNANLYVGTKTDGTLPVNAAILGAAYGRVISSGEITALSALASWANLYNSLSLTMPLATATGGIYLPTIFPSATVPAPVAMATANAPVPVVAVPTSFLGSPKQISGVAKDKHDIDGRV